jgi:RNA polymerase-binding transcription factor DksA
MHYHYFTLEQREALARKMQALAGKERGLNEREARERLRSPDYGLCEACGADVPFVRLLDDPLTRRCRRCERAG